jgi:pyridoxamine 5'-phosphate oxidase
MTSNEQTVGVEEVAVDPDPITQLSLWLELARAAGEPMPEAMAVATATTEGRPSSRMVLLRGIDRQGLVFYTDQESGKGRELKANPFAAALFHWFTPVHRQVRVTGAVEVVDVSLSDAYWQSRPPGSRRSAVASHQSQVVASRAVLEEEVAVLAEAFPDELGPPRPLRWGGYRIRPDVVELWEEGADRLHDRLRYSAEAGGWRIERLSP